MTQHAAKLTGTELVAVLRDMADRIEGGDSLEGNIFYTAIGDEFDVDQLGPDEWEVRGAYRIGNQMGQGGMRLIGEVS